MNANAMAKATLQRAPYRVLTCQIISELRSMSTAKGQQTAGTANHADPPRNIQLPGKDSFGTFADSASASAVCSSPSRPLCAVFPQGGCLKTPSAVGSNFDLAESWDSERRFPTPRTAAQNDVFEAEATPSVIMDSLGPVSGGFLPTRNYSGTLRLARKGPIEARTEKLIQLDKDLFRPRRGSFNSPRIVKADPRSAILLPVAPKLRLSSCGLTSAASSDLALGPKEELQKIYKLGDFRRRVSASILLDNMCNSRARMSLPTVNEGETPEKLSRPAEDPLRRPVNRSLSFTPQIFCGQVPAHKLMIGSLSGVLKNVKRELGPACCGPAKGLGPVKVT